MTSSSTTDPGAVYLASAQVRERYAGISAMTLWRWERDADLGFPTCVRINGRRLWSLKDLQDWERKSIATRGGIMARGAA